MSDTDTQRSDERVEAIRTLFRAKDRMERESDPYGSVFSVCLNSDSISYLFGAYDKQRARAERAEADRDDIADSYSRVLMHITDGALSMPSTDPRMAIAMSDDLDTKRWNAEMSEYEARAERAEQREARLRDIIEFIRTYDPVVVDDAEAKYPESAYGRGK